MVSCNCFLVRTGILLCALLACVPGAQAQTVNPILPLRAEWIRCPDRDVKAYGVYHFRKSFVLKARPRTFPIHVSADQRYRLFVNGKPVCFGPARGDLLNWNYESIDIAPWLQAGNNVLAAQVWNIGGGAPVAQVTAQTAFVLQGHGDAEQVVNTDTSWRVIPNEAYAPVPFPPSRLASYIVGSCDSVQFNKYPFAWQETSFDDKAWLKPEIEAKARYYTDKRMLKPRAVPFMEETPEPITHIVRVKGMDSAALVKGFDSKGRISIPAHTTTTILMDRKVLTTGYPEITFSGGSNSTVKVTYAESLFDEKNLKGNRNEIAGKKIIGYYDVFRPDGGQQHQFRPLWMRTYRFIQLDITTGAEPLTLDRLQSVFTAYPFEQKASFTSSDKSLEDIWTVGWRTARLCANETYMDCPYYEQLQYVGDTRIQALISLYVSGDDRLVRNAIEQFHQSQMPDGLTMDAYPARGGKFIPPFSLFWISMLHDYAWYRDDPAFVRKYLVPMEAVLKWFEFRIDPQTGMLGVLGFWNFVDWSFSYKGIPPGGLDGNSAILSLHYVYTLEQAAQLYQLFGEQAKATYYQALAARMRKAVYDHCYDAGRSLLADAPGRRAFSQHANIWAILTDCVAPAMQPELMKRVLNDTSLIATSPYYRFYLTKALKKAGLGDLYLATLQPWKDMIGLGFSTFPETLAPNVRSDCHAWSASPCYDFLATVGGIDTEGPGFRSVRITPHLGELSFARCSVPHPNGPIDVEYKKKGGLLEAVITLPPGLTGTFVVKGVSKPLRSGTQTLQVPEAVQDTQAIHNAQKIDLSISTIQRINDRLTVTVSNPTTVTSFSTGLTLQDFAGRSIGPVVYSDNFFNLLPGGSKTVSIDISGANQRDSLNLVMEGANARRQLQGHVKGRSAPAGRPLPAVLQPDSILLVMNKAAQWQINEWKEGRIIKLPKTEWENGALYTGIIELKKISKVPAYDRFLYAIGEECDWNTGKERLFADDYCIAQMYTGMYLEHREPKMIAKWQALADTIVNRRFDEPLTVAPHINHREWAWCDALFMGPPGLAMLTTATGDPRYLRKADTLWWKTSAFLYDPKERLYYRDSRFFTLREKNGAKVFWSRGNGWVMAGLARMMDNMPAGSANRRRYEKQFKEMAARVAGLQQPDGSWHASLLDPVTFATKETSGTAFYCYALAWGINHGLLPAKKYKPVVEKAWHALVTAVHPEGKLGFVQNIGSGPIITSYESTNVYGVGALLLAGCELYHLAK